MITSFKLNEDEIINAIIFYIKYNYKDCYLNKLDNATLIDMCALIYDDNDKIEAEFTLDDNI